MNIFYEKISTKDKILNYNIYRLYITLIRYNKFRKYIINYSALVFTPTNIFIEFTRNYREFS